MLTSVVDVGKILTDSLQDATWKLVGTMFVVTILAMIYKLIEKKLISMVDRKIYETKQKKEERKNSPRGLTKEEEDLSKQIHINRQMPSFEEWKADNEGRQR